MTDPAVLAPPRASRVLRPDSAAGAWPGEERYRVAGRGSRVVPVAAGDALRLTDVEGGQAAELMFVGADGRFDVSALGASLPVVAAGFIALMNEHEASARRTLGALRRRGVVMQRALGLKLFGGTGRAGEQAEFVVQRDGLLIVAAPADRMDPGSAATATPLELRLRRARPGTAFQTCLPEPLADALQEHRLLPGTAGAYLVRAGEYIQIIDVAGRQCSDFQAFALAKLESGLDRALDATVTRTLLGRSYPRPGLPAKAFDRDHQALVEIVQDSCGRHDAFATACGARYYDDLGYPGHANCSDNFNRALAPHGVAPRKAWEALNFFYNTWLDDQHVLHLDEPWSRPGDFVLLRALTDLVCVSSSCPDDIDPANGWNPTDIHVRVYPREERFPRAIAHRMTPDAAPEFTRETSFHERTAALTSDFVEYRGYWLPRQFHNHGVLAEYWACRQGVVISDLSALRKFEVTGPDAEALLQWCVTRDVRKLAIGQVSYTAICHEHGGMLDDATLMRLGEHGFRLICGDDFTGLWLRQQAESKGYQAWVRSSTEQMHNLAVQGPRSRELLEQIIWTAPSQVPLAQLQWFRFVPARIGHFEGPPVVVSRTGYTGELGYEVFCHPKDALAVFDAIWAAGAPLGLVPMGMDALDKVRIEAGLVFAHQEFDDATDPFEAGIGFTVPLKSKEVDFIGRAALLERQGRPRQVLVGLELDGNEVAGHGDCVHIGRARIGVVTSGTYSPLLQRSIALARVEAVHAAHGTEIEVGQLDGHQKRLPGTVVRSPHYDPQKTRVKG